jgi:hypothetical protein
VCCAGFQLFWPTCSQVPGRRVPRLQRRDPPPDPEESYATCEAIAPSFQVCRVSLSSWQVDTVSVWGTAA